MTTPMLTAATAERRKHDVVLTWTVGGNLEDSRISPWLLSATLVGGEDGPIHEIGFRFRDGKVEERFVLDHVTSTNYYVSKVEPERVGQKWTAVFPAEADVATSGKWTSALSFDEPKFDPNADTSRIEGRF